MAFTGIVNEKLTEENYENWKKCMKSYLISEGLWGVVYGDEKEPQKSYDGCKYDQWAKKNGKALHAIQISCEPKTIANVDNEESAKCQWDRSVEMVPAWPQGNGLLLKEGESNLVFQYEDLYRAIDEGDLGRVRMVLGTKPCAVREKITLQGNRALHVAVLAGQMQIVRELVRMMEKDDLELKNDMKDTALSIAIINKSREMVEVMVEKNSDLLTAKNSRGAIPVVVASWFYAEEMVRYLYFRTPKEILKPEDEGRSGATLLTSLIADEFFDLALDLVNQYPQLGITEDINRDYAIKLLARTPSAFLSEKSFVFWKRWIYNSCIKISQTEFEGDNREPRCDEENVTKNCQGRSYVHNCSLLKFVWKIIKWFVPDIKHIREAKLKRARAVKLLKIIFKEIPRLDVEQLEKIGLEKAIYDAIENGMIDFINEIITLYPEIIWRKDKTGRTLFANAIVLRQEEIFNLVFKLGSKTNSSLFGRDIFDNNFLHLAGKLSPTSRLECFSGPALQMQRELQWFEELKEILPPKCLAELNVHNKTPAELFSDMHEELIIKGEKWMKDNATSCMVVAGLIAAVMFTSAFTVPGGNNDKTGLPIFIRSDAFLVFVITNSLSLFSSATSLLVFLGVLTSKYAEKEFHTSLPTKSILGLFTLFFSIVTMMIAFGSAIFITLKARLAWISVPVIILSTFPIAFFAFLQFPLLIEMLLSTYCRHILDKSSHKLFRKFH